MFVSLFNLITEEADMVFSQQPLLLAAYKNYKFDEGVFIAQSTAALSHVPGDMAVDEWMDTHDLVIGDQAENRYIFLSSIYRSLEARGDKLKAYKIVAPLEVLRLNLW